MPNTIFSRPDLTAFTCLDGVGWRRRASACGQTMRCWRAGSLVRIGGVDAAGVQGEVRDTVVRRPAHEPYGWRPTIVHVSVRRYRCQGCAHASRQDTSQAAQPRAKLSRSAVRWALTGLVVHHVTVARIVQALGMSRKSR